ncbi:MAG: TonB-dependent receptor [Prevotellaceae bacterium]|jgi:outer membrane receptor protein involved in Fe transport|nr:TonB-dependent receptor [Prevotellaceae bacterium]
MKKWFVLSGSILLPFFLQAAVSDTLSQIYADRPDSAAYRQIDLSEVVVTGFKQDRLKVEPLSASSLNSRFLRNHQIQTVKDLSVLLPNFYMPDYGSRQASPIYIRGIGSKVNAPSVGFYVDGVPRFERSALDIDLSDISNIEVLRGPQGTLYGRNAIGGIINVYTHSPLDYRQTRFRAGYGSRNDIQVSASTYNKLTDRLGISARGYYHHNDGFFTNLYNGRKADNMNEGSAHLAWVWKPADRWTVRANTSLDYNDQGGYPYGKYDETTGKTDPVDYNEYSSYRRTIVTSGVNLRYTDRRISFNSQTAYQYIRDRQNIDQDFTPESKSYIMQRLKQHLVSQELTLKSTTESRYRHITGVFAFYQGVDKEVHNRIAATVKNYDIPTFGLALYHQSTLQLLKPLRLLLGVRYDYERARERQQSSRLQFNQLTPKVTLQYNLTADNLLYAALSRGYKAGGFNTAFDKDDATTRTFKPEYNWNYEVGAKLSAPDNRLSAELSLFYIDWRHQQITQYVPGAGYLQRNAGHSESKGVEVSLQYQPVDNLNIGVNYGYTYARFLHYRRDEQTDYSHHLIPMVPRRTLAVSASYSVLRPCRAIDRITLSGLLSAAGDIYWAEDNDVKQPFYALLNLKLAITKSRFTWEIWGKNLTDTRYHTYYFKLGNSGFAQLGKPLTAGTALVITL